MISPIAADASSTVRSSRRCSLSMRALNIYRSRKFRSSCAPFAGQHRLGVELHAVHRAPCDAGRP